MLFFIDALRASGDILKPYIVYLYSSNINVRCRHNPSCYKMKHCYDAMVPILDLAITNQDSRDYCSRP